MTTILLALASAACFGTGVALQQRPAREAPAHSAGRPALLALLVRRPTWLLGLAGQVAGFVLQILALRSGSLVVVQATVATSLLFSLAWSRLWSGRRLTTTQLVAASMVVAGLIGYLVLPASTHPNPPVTPGMWWLAAAAAGMGSLAAAVAGLGATGGRRAGLLGLAAGLADCAMAVLALGLGHTLAHGPVAVLGSPLPYALVGAGLGAMLLAQSAYQAGQPMICLPVTSVVDPIAATLLGVAVLGERLNLAGTRGPAVALSLVVLLAGIVVLARTSARTLEPASRPKPGPWQQTTMLMG